MRLILPFVTGVGYSLGAVYVLRRHGQAGVRLLRWAATAVLPLLWVATQPDHGTVMGEPVGPALAFLLAVVVFGCGVAAASAIVRRMAPAGGPGLPWGTILAGGAGFFLATTAAGAALYVIANVTIAFIGADMAP